MEKTDIVLKEKDIKKNKGFFKSKTGIAVLIVAAILLIGGLIIGGSYIFPKNIAGAWELRVNPELPVATADEISEGDKVYYVFDKPDRYGRGEYYTCYQGGVEYFKYELLEEESVQKINLGTKDMEYKITGSKLLGNAKLTVVFPAYKDEITGEEYEDSEYIFIQAQSPEYEKQAFENYDTDRALIGMWTNNERSLSYYQYSYTYEQTVEFTDAGVMVIHYESADLGLDRYMYYSYTSKDNELTFSLVTDKETKYTVSYEFDDKGNLNFINDTTENSIFANAFFGNFTFYTAENLPEPTAASADEMYFTE